MHFEIFSSPPITNNDRWARIWRRRILGRRIITSSWIKKKFYFPLHTHDFYNLKFLTFNGTEWNNFPNCRFIVFWLDDRKWSCRRERLCFPSWSARIILIDRIFFTCMQIPSTYRLLEVVTHAKRNLQRFVIWVSAETIH